jgi:hypothetical protein
MIGASSAESFTFSGRAAGRIALGRRSADDEYNRFRRWTMRGLHNQGAPFVAERAFNGDGASALVNNGADFYLGDVRVATVLIPTAP